MITASGTARPAAVIVTGNDHRWCPGRRDLPRIHTLAGVLRTPLNSYDSIVRPIEAWLAERGVVVEHEVRVTNVELTTEGESRRVSQILLQRRGIDDSIAVGPDDLVFLALGSMTADATYGDDTTAPELVAPRPARPPRRSAGARRSRALRTHPAPRICGAPSPQTGPAMKAAVVTEFGAPLEIQEVPIPQPGPGQVLVQIETSGLCHTDIHAANGDSPVQPTLPFVPGHEGIGRVTALGAGVTARAVGDRVAIAWLGYACGRCRYCIGGRETLCEQQENSGYSVDGTFAEFAVAAAAFATPVPDNLDARDAAALTCAGVTTYKAVKVAQVAPAETVAVFGIGGLGHLAVQYARIAGGFVVAVDVTEEKLRMATELGADHVVNARETDPVVAIQALGGADVAIALAASPASFDQAYRSLRRGGRLVCVAMPADDGALSLPIFDTVINGKTVIGSIVGTRNDLADVFALHKAGRTRVIAVDRKLDEVNQCIHDVLAGHIAARVVFQF